MTGILLGIAAALMSAAPALAQDGPAADRTTIAARGGALTVPCGYKPAWTDGRLNPQRGPRTALGHLQMAQVLDPDSVPMEPATAASRARYPLPVRR